MRILVDTNLLLRSLEEMHAQQAGAAAAIDQCLSLGHQLVIVPQVLYEFWVVARRSDRQNGLGWTTEEVEIETTKLLRFFKLLRDERNVFDHWLDLATRYDVKGKNAHDARFVAAMERHGLEYILTFNTKDFERYQGVHEIQPDDLLDRNISLNGKS